MKTLTEFDGFLLTRALTTKRELTTAGKTPEELQQALGEAFKYEGDKLKLFLSALEVAETKSERLKRVLVIALNEGEKAPTGAVQKEDKHLLAEYFYAPSPKQNPRDGKGRGPRDGKRARGKGKGGRGDRKPREPRSDRSNAQPRPNGGASTAPNPGPSTKKPTSPPVVIPRVQTPKT